MGIMRYKSLRSMVNGAVAPVPFVICGDDTIEVELSVTMLTVACRSTQ